MARVSAPYNFVPLNKEVFFPSWAKFVNHDIPFKNGLSGQIKLKITAESPIFIRKPYEEGDPTGSYYTNRNGDEISKEFCHIKDKNGNKQYYIPGSSLRNMIRSVVEIMSFGKLDFYNKTKRFSFRDMANPDLYTLRRDVTNRLRFGWLKKEARLVEIIDCGKLGDLRDRNNENTIFRTQRNDEFSDLTHNEFNEFTADDTSLERKYEIYNKYYYSASDFEDSENDFIAVLTGNIQGKRNEFIFPNPKEAIDCEVIDISENVMSQFLETYKDDPNWSFWKDIYEREGYVPVFFRKRGRDIIDFGLTVLYKMLHKNKLEQIVNRQQPKNSSNSLDLAQCIFGDIDEDNNTFKLKGRVQVAHAFSNNAQRSTLASYILGEPKNSYYPFYIQQDVLNNSSLRENIKYETLSTSRSTLSKISGRKRYPIHYKFAPGEISPIIDNNNQDVVTYFTPLNSNAIFETTINYHNLLPEELGALLSAISFHENQNSRHNIGLAKAYGYGRIKIEIKNLSEQERKKHIGLFEKVMTKFDPNWINSIQLTELISMAQVSPQQDRRKLKYMNLSDFYSVKVEKKALPLYSKFMNIPIHVDSIESDMNLSSIKDSDSLIEEEKSRIEKILKLVTEKL